MFLFSFFFRSFYFSFWFYFFCSSCLASHTHSARFFPSVISGHVHPISSAISPPLPILFALLFLLVRRSLLLYFSVKQLAKHQNCYFRRYHFQRMISKPKGFVFVFNRITVQTHAHTYTRLYVLKDWKFKGRSSRSPAPVRQYFQGLVQIMGTFLISIYYVLNK